ncbi:MAG: hypothetical protein IPM24_24475 [Bryobacterales bacterium]|nr:hypothetical protein [Bryobacterales bacterium]
MTRLWAFLLLLAIPAAAQFGGRDGDVVVYVLSSKGSGEVRGAGATATNTAGALSRFEVIETATREVIPLGEGFPDEFTRQILHEEPDDLFQLVTQFEGLPGPHRIFLVSYKTFIINGLVRETEFENVDYTAGALTTLKKDVNFGPDLALDTLEVLFWGNDSKFPAVEMVPLGVSGPAVPPGITGDELIFNLGRVPFFIPWKNMRRLEPGAGWGDGIDLKLVERDIEEGSTIHLLRLRPGARTPNFRIDGATHFFVLQGELRLTVPGAGEFVMPPKHYAFIPPGLAVQGANLRRYEGPGR